MKKAILRVFFAAVALAPCFPVAAADQLKSSDVVCTGQTPNKPGFVCSDGTRISLDGVEFSEVDKTPKFDISRKLLKVVTRIELQQCETGRRSAWCKDKPWDDIDFVSVENEADCVDKARFIAFEKWLRASRQGFDPSITWTCM
jgi:hypothetical protein